MQPDVLQIEHAEYGTETFAVGDARCNVFQRDDGVWELVIYLETREAIVRSPELEEVLDAEPHLEASVIMDEAPRLQRGTEIIQEHGYDHERDQNLTVLYYFEHESVERLRIVLLEVTEQWIDAEVTGVSVVNGSRGPDPDATLAVRTKFRRDAKLRRSFS